MNVKTFTVIILLSGFLMCLPGGAVFAKGYMSVKLGAQARFVYVQVIDVLDGHFTVQTDVTGQVPHEAHTIGGQKLLIIN